MDGSGHTEPRDKPWRSLSWLGSWALSPAHSCLPADCGPSLPGHIVPRCFLTVTECQCFLQEAWLRGRLLPQELPLAGPGTSRQIGASPRLFVLTSVSQKLGDGFPILQAAETSERGALGWAEARRCLWHAAVSHGTICWKHS